MVQIMRVRAVSTGWQGGPGLNTFYFRTYDLTNPDGDNATAVIARVHAGFGELLSCYPTQHSIQVDPIVDVFEAASGVLVDSLSGTGVAPVVGTNSTSYGPLPSGLCVNLTTGAFVNGRRVQGRAFLSPCALIHDTDGSPQTARREDAEAAISVMRDGVETTERLVVWHRPVSGAGGSAHEVTGEICRDKFAVLRSRRD